MTSVNRGTTQSTRRGISFGSLVAFFALTFGLAWGIGVLLVLFTAQIEAIFGPVGYTNPVFILIVWTPGLVGVFLVWWHYGLRGLLSFFRRRLLLGQPRVAAGYGALLAQALMHRSAWKVDSK